MDEKIVNAILLEFPQLLKKQLQFDVENSKKDYMSRLNNIEKYIYNACEMLQVSGISYNKYIEEISKWQNDQFKDDIGEVIGRNFEIEARLYLRRVMELFIETFNFKLVYIDHREKVIRQYHLIRAFQAYSQKKKLKEKYEELTSLYIQSRIDSLKTELSSLEDVFYLDSTKKLSKDKDIPRLIMSFESLLKFSLPIMDDMQKELVGNSYQKYASTSNVIHGYSGLMKFSLLDYHQELDALYAQIYLFGIMILKDLVQIGEGVLEDSEILRAILELKSSLSEEFTIELDDIVLVKNQIKAKIVDIKESSYKIKKYKVEYIEKLGDFTLSFPDEWYLLRDLRKIP